MATKLTDNVDLIGGCFTAEVWLPGETIVISAFMWDLDKWMAFAREAMAAKDPESPMGAAGKYVKARFGAKLVIHPEDEEQGLMKFNSSLFAIDARGKSRAVRDPGHWKEELPRVAEFAVSMLADAGFNAELASAVELQREQPRVAARSVIKELALMTTREATASKERFRTIDAIFNPDERRNVEESGTARMRAETVAEWPDAAASIDFACRGEKAKPHQWIADLVARAMLTQYVKSTCEWSGLGDKTSIGTGRERRNALAMALAAITALPAMESIPVFDGNEPFPERPYAKKFKEGCWKKPDLAGMDMLDALLSPELSSRVSMGRDDLLIRLIIATLKRTPIQHGRSAELLPMVLGGQKALGFCDEKNDFEPKEAAAIAAAIAGADPGFSLASIDWSGGSSGITSAECVDLIAKENPAAWEALLAREKSILDVAAGPARKLPKRAARI